MSSAQDDTSIKVHPQTLSPTKAWQMLQVKQKVTKVTPLSPDTPIREDHIRFVCLSDTHTMLEKQGPAGLEFVPKGDVLLHGGDFSNVGLPKDIKGFNDYLGLLPHTLKVVIAGNHDMTMDSEMVQCNRQYLTRNFSIKESVFEEYLKEAGVENSRQLLTNCVYLEDSSIDVCGIKIYGSPWQPEFGGWGFNLVRGGPLLEKWNMIPDDTDILITHGPPIGHGDKCFSELRAGCVELLSTIQRRVKPLYHIFGHIHEGYGVTSDGYTTYINASTCTLRYKATNPAVVFDFPIPEGHTKKELDNIPKCNL
ncbi:metallophosphoesterase MPPED2-like isoform X2 [Babylonia areolata]